MTADDRIKADAQAVISGETPWRDVAADLWNAMSEWIGEVSFGGDRIAWSLIGWMFDYETVTDPQNINYPFCGGEWTAAADARVVKELGEHVAAYDALNAMRPGETVWVRTYADGSQDGYRMDERGVIYGATVSSDIR